MSRVEHSARIHGTGVAALTCARLLARQGWQVHLEKAQRTRPAHLLLGQATANLLAALWNDSTLLECGHAIRERAVRWGQSSNISVLAAPGIVIATDELIRRLEARTESAASSRGVGATQAWEIDAQPRRSGGVPPILEIGRRHAWLARARLKANAIDSRCLMEALERGWVFLLPLGHGAADLQFVSIPSEVPQPDPEQVITRSTMISEVVSEIDPWMEPFASMPKYHPAPAQPGNLAIGEAAISFDPISGDGVGHALRGVVLAATTLDAIMRGESSAECVKRYAGTLHRAMAHHLEICLKLYGDAMRGRAWRDELDAARSALARLSKADREPMR